MQQWKVEYLPFPTSTLKAEIIMPVYDGDTEEKVRERFDAMFGLKQGWQFVSARKGMF